MHLKVLPTTKVKIEIIVFIVSLGIMSILDDSGPYNSCSVPTFSVDVGRSVPLM